MNRWITFDVGETIFDERGLWARWADWLGVDRQCFILELQATIRAGRHHREVFQMFRPGFDIEQAEAERRAEGDPPGFVEADLFPDVRGAFAKLRAEGYKIAIAGNTSLATEQVLARAGLGADLIASAARWQVEKPNPAFFQCLSRACGAEFRDMVYVGDRIDNDVLPALGVGMAAVWLRRGMWAQAHADWYGAHRASVIIDHLDALPNAIAAQAWRSA
ncbi:MAG: HAD family hydrolase [Hyphomicrobiaceae bacterium]